MSQTMLNDCQACWFIQLMSYNFTIQYCWDILNSADESSQKLNYMMKQSERHHESTEKFYELSFKQFWLTFIQNSNSSLIFVEDKLTFWQIDDLISILINKLVTVMLRTGRQYNCCIRKTDFEMKYLIWVLSL